MRKLLILGAFLSGCAISPAEVQKLQAESLPIAITEIAVGGYDAAGGIDAVVLFKNLSDKPFKYARFNVVPYNRVGDQQQDLADGRSKVTLTANGPIGPGVSNGHTFFGTNPWTRVWYNRNITCMELREVQVIYMDDSEETFMADQVPKLLTAGVVNSCQPR